MDGIDLEAVLQGWGEAESSFDFRRSNVRRDRNEVTPDQMEGIERILLFWLLEELLFEVVHRERY